MHGQPLLKLVRSVYIQRVPCWKCDQDREDPKKKAQLFTVESVKGIKFAFSEAPCADVVSQGRENTA